MIYKQYATTIRKDAGRQRRFIISTPSVDRDGDTVAINGWDLTAFRANPVVLPFHDYTALPLGKCTDIRQQGNALVATVEFANHPMAQTVLEMIDGGFLSATSVGFRPISGSPNYETGGTDYSKAELLEFSIVSVPANPEALIQRGIDTTPLRQWAQKILKQGRVLSGENEQHVVAARDLARQCAERCEAVLSNLYGDGDGDKPDDGFTDDLVIDGEGDDRASRVAAAAAARVKRALDSKWRRSSGVLRDFRVIPADQIDIAAISPMAGDTRGRSPRRHLSWSDVYGANNPRAETGVSRAEALSVIDETFRELLGDLLRDEINAGIRRGRGRAD